LPISGKPDIGARSGMTRTKVSTAAWGGLAEGVIRYKTSTRNPVTE
jgi:hypothetical protein